jgi:uncharacterized membrane protein
MNCTTCGKEVAETVKFCDGCGTPLSSKEENMQGSVRSASPNQEIKEHKGIFMLSYVLFFLPLISCPTSKIGRFHANQGLVLLITSVAGNIAVSILSSLLTWRLWAITSFIGWAWGIVVLALIIIGMVNANKGEQKPLPVIGGFTIIK